ncbi:hypothetical protein HUU42_16755 [bacterium]|nr:hypothetical protein [bacterium]
MFKIDNQTGSVHFKGKAIDWDVSDPLPGANIVIATLDKDSLEFSWRFYIKCIASADRDGIFTLSCNLGKQDVLFIKMQGYNSLVYNIGKFI